jgi:hypothetical protein
LSAEGKGPDTRQDNFVYRNRRNLAGQLQIGLAWAEGPGSHALWGETCQMDGSGRDIHRQLHSHSLSGKD